MRNENQQVQALLQPMLKRKLFVVISRAVATQEQMKPHVVEHLKWMNRMQEEGKLWASGPFPQEGVTVGDGLTIFQAASYEEAESWIKENR